MQVSYYTQTVTDAGVTLSFNVETLIDGLILVPNANPTTMLANITVNFTGTPVDGQIVRIGWGTGFTLNGNSMTINGIALTDLQALKEGSIEFAYLNSAWGDTYSPDFRISGTISGDVLQDETVTLAKVEDLARGYVIIGNSSNRPTAVDANGSGYILVGDGTDLNSVAQSGDVIFSTAGVSAIQAGVIVDADINAAAAITRSKIANGTASHVVINNGGGALSSEAQLDETRGGTGIDSSASTGFATISSGTWAASTIAVDRDLDISFESGEVGDFKIYMGFAGTLTNIYAYATKAIAGTDNGTIVPKNNAGTTMATGTITFTASDARGTAYTATPSTNNTFIAGDILTFTCAKTTAGGKAHLSLKFTRTS